MMIVRYKVISIFLFFVFLALGCGTTLEESEHSSVETSTVPTNMQETDSQPSDFFSGSPEDVDLGDFSDVDSVPTVESAESAFVIPTRQVPDNFAWRQAPVIPEISDTVLEIFKKGMAQGRDSSHFSVVGDCQAIPFVFMGPIGRRELLPGGSEQYLWDSIRYFDLSLNRESVSVRGGFTAASLMNPMQADQRQCRPGETPLTCEYRLHSPAFVFITLENWRNPDTIDRYEIYLRDILEYVISRGSVPILITKADTSEVPERIHIINPAIAKLAYEYDVPLVNFWRAAQSLPNRGIDPEREGFHLSQDGYNLKNLLAFRALHLTRQKINAEFVESAVIEPEPVIEPVLEADETYLTPEVSPLFQPDCGGGCVFFGMAQSQDGEIESLGVLAYEYANQSLVQFLPGGFDLQDLNPDGQHLLVNRENFLYALNLDDLSSSLVSDNLYWQGERGAYWAGSGPGADIVFIDSESPHQGGQGHATRLFISGRSQTVFFDSGFCEGKDHCESEGIYQQHPGQSAILLDNVIRPAFSPDGNWIAFINPEAVTKENHGKIRYFIMQDPNKGLLGRKVIYLPARRGFRVFPDISVFSFSPQSDKLFIYYDIYSAYFEKSLRFETYLLDLNNGILHEYGDMLGNSGSLNPKIVWSPDGRELLLFLTDLDEHGLYSLGIYRTLIGTDERLRPYDEDIYRDQNYFYITNIGWLSP
jgi:hypothetical protein